MGAFRKKIALIKAIEADIYIIQECENLEQSKGAYDAWLPNIIWKGINKNKGIAVFSKLDLEELEWNDNELELFLPIKVNKDLQLLAIWTKHANSPTFQYIGQLWKYLQLHTSKLKERPSIICGDLNSNAQWDVWDRWWNHSDVVDQLQSMNICSLYHELREEKQGEESEPTFFMHRNQIKKYHIDYLFSHRSLFIKEKSECTIFPREYWLEHSDHLPMLFNLKA